MTNNNSLSEDIYVVGQLMADNLNSVGVVDADVDDGLTTLANEILNASGSKTLTILTLNTPMLVYTDTFTVTGTLTDDEETPISEATIQLIWNDGTEHIATGVTNSNGVFTFTSTDPASVSAYSFQLFFAGDNDYAQSNSSVVNVNTAKETSVMVITSPASGSTVSTDSVTVSGTLKDNDNTAMSGKSISFSLNNVSAGTATVESDGSFSKTVTGLIAGSNSISASFAATTTHTAASQSITVNRSTFDSLADIELIEGNQILSYADEQQTPGSQYAILETQLMVGDSPAAIDGVEIGFWDFTDDSSPVFLGSDYSDSAGKASFTYHSRGVGDVPIKAAAGSIVSKTYSIKDYLYVPKLDGTETIHQLSGTTTISNGEMSGGSGFIGAFDNSGDWEITLQAKFSNSNCGFMIINPPDTTRDMNCLKAVKGGNGIYSYVNGTTTSPVSMGVSLNTNTYYTFTIRKYNGALTLQVDNNAPVTLSWSLISTLSTLGIGVDTWGHIATIKNIIVKPL